MLFKKIRSNDSDDEELDKRLDLDTDANETDEDDQDDGDNGDVDDKDGDDASAVRR